MDSNSLSIFSGEITSLHSCPSASACRQCRHLRSRSSSSASSSSCSSAGAGGDSPFSPISSFSLAGIPFSWEQHPGIPKKSSTKSPNSLILDDRSLLPLPPPKKFDFGIGRIGRSTYYKADPFVAALMKCSRENREEDQWPASSTRSAGVVSRAVSDRFGLKIDRYMLSSCKSSCGVVEPIAINSRPANHRSGYSLIRKS